MSHYSVAVVAGILLFLFFFAMIVAVARAPQDNPAPIVFAGLSCQLWLAVLLLSLLGVQI